jgi:hypothetical protein
MTTTAPLTTLTSHVFGLRRRASEPVTWDVVKDLVYENTVVHGREPCVYKVPDRDGNGMTVIAYRHFADPSKIIGVHEVWRHRDSFPKSGCGPECCGP